MYGAPDVERADVEDANHVLALQRRGRARLAQEAGHCLPIGDHTRRHQLDRHLLAELDVLHQEDDTHPADAQNRLHAVFSGEDVARLGHVVRRHGGIANATGSVSHPGRPKISPTPLPDKRAAGFRGAISRW